MFSTGNLLDCYKKLSETEEMFVPPRCTQLYDVRGACNLIAKG